MYIQYYIYIYIYVCVCVYIYIYIYNDSLPASETNAEMNVGETNVETDASQTNVETKVETNCGGLFSSRLPRHSGGTTCLTLLV